MKITITGYHFTNSTLRNGDPIPKIGTWLKHEGKVIPCETGLHMSVEPFDALTYAPGNILHMVKLRGNLMSHGNPIDKWAGSERMIIKSIDATDLLRQFARDCALSVVHLWNAPEIVVKYLKTGNESIRTAAGEAARAAAWAAWEAARAAQRKNFNALVEKAFH